MKLLEILNTIAINPKWLNNNEVIFKLNGLEYGLIFSKLNISDFDLLDELKKIKTDKVYNIIFGNIINDNFVTKSDGKSKFPLKVISIVKNLILKWVEKEKPEIIIFAAKNQDAVYSSRKEVYKGIINIFLKTNNDFKKYIFEDETGTYFILTTLFLSKRQQIEIKKELMNLDISDKLKYIKN